MVLVRASNNEVFEIDPAWLPVFFGRVALNLPMNGREVMEQLVGYSNELQKLSKKPTKDAFATGAAFLPEPTNMDRAKESFTQDFIVQYDEILMSRVGYAARRVAGDYQLLGTILQAALVRLTRDTGMSEGEAEVVAEITIELGY